MTVSLAKLAHSYSSIKMFYTCPLKYYFQRIAKSVVDKGGPASIEGERIHSALEHRLRDKKPLVDKDKIYETICHAVENISEGGNIYLEHKLTLNKNLEPVSWFHETAWLRSILDVLVIKDDVAYIIDWKTGKRRPDFDQLSMSALQIWQHYPTVKTVKTSFVWLQDMDMDSQTFSIKDKAFLWAQLNGRIEPIYEAYKRKQWPSKPSGLCRYCPANTICEDARL